MSTRVHDIAFIGCGSVGRPLARLLHQAGVSIKGLSCSTLDSARDARRFIGAGDPIPPEKAAASARTVIIATPDRAIAEADILAAKGIEPGGVVLHLSGALPSSILSASRNAGAAAGSMHPLQSFTDPEEAVRLVAGSVFACEGDDDAVAVATGIAGLVGARPIVIRTETKSLYHAAAATASNFLASVLCFGVDLMELTGMTRATALEALMPLIEGTLANARTQGLPQALTGPIERGDAGTVRIHLEAIRKACPHLENGYTALAEMTIDAALRKGSIDERTAAALRDVLAES